MSGPLAWVHRGLLGFLYVVLLVGAFLVSKQAHAAPTSCGVGVPVCTLPASGVFFVERVVRSATWDPNTGEPNGLNPPAWEYAGVLAGGTEATCVTYGYFDGSGNFDPGAFAPYPLSECRYTDLAPGPAASAPSGGEVTAQQLADALGLSLPTSADSGTAWGIGFVLVVGCGALGAAVGAVLSMLRS